MRHRPRTMAGKAANRKPSMANTRPIATTKSDIAAAAVLPLRAARAATLAPPPLPPPPGGLAAAGAGLLPPALGRPAAFHGARRPLGSTKKRKNSESGLTAACVSFGPQARLVGLHRAVEVKKSGRVERIREDAVALGVAFAADLLGLGGRVGDQHRHVAVGARPDLLGTLAALGAELRRLALALGLHALVDRLAVGFRQVGAADAHVDDVDAVDAASRSSCSRMRFISGRARRAPRCLEASPRRARGAAPS
jgi:hypothetical protein